MRWIFRLGAALALLASPALAAGSGFLTEVDDLPLPPGFTELPGGTLFEAPQGRIVEANAQGKMLEAEARQFYSETLPQLGWTRIGPSEFRRDKEALRLDLTFSGMQVNIHYSLAPISSGAGGDDKDKGAK
jgi:hypothetical protein